MERLEQARVKIRDHSQYEKKYRIFYDAGVDFVSTNGYGREFELFLKQQSEKGLLLECGCGEGFASAFAANLGYEVLGVDSAPSAVAKAMNTHCAKHGNLTFMNGDVCMMDEIESETFDIVADIGCLHMIGHPDDAQSYLKNVFRLLKTNGQGFFQNRVSPGDAMRWFPAKKDWIERWRQRIEKCNSDFECQSIEAGDCQVEIRVPTDLGAVFRDIDEYVPLFTEAGFEIEHLCVVFPGVNSPFEVVIEVVKAEASRN